MIKEKGLKKSYAVVVQKSSTNFMVHIFEDMHDSRKVGKNTNTTMQNYCLPLYYLCLLYLYFLQQNMVLYILVHFIGKKPIKISTLSMPCIKLARRDSL